MSSRYRRNSPLSWRPNRDSRRAPRSFRAAKPSGPSRLRMRGSRGRERRVRRPKRPSPSASEAGGGSSSSFVLSQSSFFFPPRCDVLQVLGSRALGLPAGPFLPQPEEEDINRNAYDRENEDDREKLRHSDQRGIVGQAIAETLGAANHLGADRRQESEDRADHQPDDDHRHRHRNRDLGEYLQRAGAERAGQRDLREIGAPETGGGIDHHHRPARQRHGDDARLASKAE